MTMTTPLLLLCSLFPLAASLSISASIGEANTGNQFLHATVDWSTGALKGVQYLPGQAKPVSMNAPCFIQSLDASMDGSTLMCRDKTEAFVAVCNLTDSMEPKFAFIDASGGQLFAVRANQLPTSLYSMDLNTCAIRWDVTIEGDDPSIEAIVVALGMPTGGGMLNGLAYAAPGLSFTIDTSTGNITSEKSESFNEAFRESSVAYDAARHVWLGLNVSGGGKFGDVSGINMFSMDAHSLEKVKAFQTFAIPASWIDKFPADYPFLTCNSVILEDGKLHASFIQVQNQQTGAYFNPVVTIDANTGKLLAAVEVQFPGEQWSIDAINPSWVGCPGGTLRACMELCPSSPPAVYRACVQTCAERCK